MPHALLLSLAFSLSGAPPQPCDHLQAFALAIVRGSKGQPSREQLNIARYVIANDLKVQGRALVTEYGPPKFPRSAHTASGAHCSERAAAVTINEFKRYRGMYVFMQGFGLRQIQDCGANFNNGIAKRKHADRWFDSWSPRPRASVVTPYAFIPRKAGR